MRIVVGLSGGVDSAVTAFLLQRFCRTTADVALLQGLPSLGPVASECRAAILADVAQLSRSSADLLEGAEGLTKLLPPQQRPPASLRRASKAGGETGGGEERGGSCSESPVEVHGACMMNWQAAFESGFHQQQERRSSSFTAGGDRYPDVPRRRCAEQECEDAEATASKLRLAAFHPFDFSAEYWNACFDPMLRAFLRGHTLNVDLLCNQHIKFGVFLEHLGRRLGEDRAEQRRLEGGEVAGIAALPPLLLATGHYARTIPAGARRGAVLCRPETRVAESLNDQSYFLSFVGHAALARACFPIGQLGFTKQEVRHIAALVAPRWIPAKVAAKPTSTGLCFVDIPRRGAAQVKKEGGKEGNPKRSVHRSQAFAAFISEYSDLANARPIGDGDDGNSDGLRVLEARVAIQPVAGSDVVRSCGDDLTVVQQQQLTLDLPRELLDVHGRPLPYAVVRGQRVMLRRRCAHGALRRPASLVRAYVVDKVLRSAPTELDGADERWIEAIIVCTSHNDNALMSTTFNVRLAPTVDVDELLRHQRDSLWVSVRHQQTPVRCRISLLPTTDRALTTRSGDCGVDATTGSDVGVAVEAISGPLRCVTGGQAAVFYGALGDAPRAPQCVLGGGWICG